MARILYDRIVGRATGGLWSLPQGARTVFGRPPGHIVVCMSRRSLFVFVTVQYPHSYEQKSIDNCLRQWDFCLLFYVFLRSAQQVRRPTKQLQVFLRRLNALISGRAKIKHGNHWVKSHSATISSTAPSISLSPTWISLGPSITSPFNKVWLKDFKSST